MLLRLRLLLLLLEEMPQAAQWLADLTAPQGLAGWNHHHHHHQQQQQGHLAAQVAGLSMPGPQCCLLCQQHHSLHAQPLVHCCWLSHSTAAHLHQQQEQQQRQMRFAGLRVL
jgi:hypothetical protein